MKSLTSYLLLALFVLSFASCEKEEPESNHFEYELIKYEIDEGMIESYGKLNPDATGYNFDVTLYSTGIVFNPGDGSFTGSGNIVILEMFSESKDELKAGTYTFDNLGSMDPYTFDIGRFGLFVNMDEQTGTIILANSGTIKVSQSGDSWTFDFNCSTSADNTITGSFTGELDFYDHSNSGMK